MTVYFLDYGRWPSDRTPVGIFTKEAMERYMADHPLNPAEDGAYEWFPSVLNHPDAEVLNDENPAPQAISQRAGQK
jgi:hypothetical protein